MNLTDYHAKYFAHELTKRCSSDSLEKLAGAVVGAKVDLNPHQMDAALFAFNSPLSKGAVLDEETAARMLSLSGKVAGPLDSHPPDDQLNALVEKRKAETQRNISERNARFFEAETDKLEG